MKFSTKLISMILALLMVFSALPIVTFAAAEKTYIKEIRISTAADEATAKQWLTEKGYQVLDVNLNQKSNGDAVYMGYITTTNPDEAITDMAVMQMDGGYNEGNYQEMIKQSYEEYLEFGENYLIAIDHFNKGIDAGHYLSELAHRQLNFYNVVTEGIDEIPDFEGERLGDIFYDGIDGRANFF